MTRATKERDLIFSKRVIDSAKAMAKKSLTVATWGNISVRDPETGRIYVTPSGYDYKKAKPDDVVVFDAKGIRVKGQRKPTIEKDLHIELYQARDDLNAIIHTHAMYSTVIGVAGLSLPAITEEFAQTLGHEAPLCKYAIPGSPDLAKYVVEGFGENHFAVLMPSHGAVCAAADMDMALKQCDVLERAAEIFILAQNLIDKHPEGQLRPIPSEDVDHMFRFHNNQYMQK